jgi:hypothetical protein
MTWQQVGEEVFRPAQWMANVQAVWPFFCYRRGKQKNLRIRHWGIKGSTEPMATLPIPWYFLELAARRAAAPSLDVSYATQLTQLNTTRCADAISVGYYLH